MESISGETTRRIISRSLSGIVVSVLTDETEWYILVPNTPSRCRFAIFNYRTTHRPRHTLVTIRLHPKNIVENGKWENNSNVQIPANMVPQCDRERAFFAKTRCWESFPYRKNSKYNNPIVRLSQTCTLSENLRGTKCSLLTTFLVVVNNRLPHDGSTHVADPVSLSATEPAMEKNRGRARRRQKRVPCQHHRNRISLRDALGAE